MREELMGKVALVTGGGTGIGKAISLSLAEKGVNLVINYFRSENEANETAEEIRQKGVDVTVQKADVSDGIGVRKMFENAFANFERLDMLINCAGYTQFVPHKNLDSLTDDIWNRTLDVNLKGVFLCSREAAKLMLKTGKGSIINIVGTAGVTGLGSSIVYCASKAGILSLTRSMAIALAPEIQVNAISPGTVEDTRWCIGQEKFNKISLAQTPMKRLAKTSDIAEVALFLLSGSHFITGQNLVVDGGRVVC
jgi:3-oxoacyl-[acyl-carrier protein] reductase